MAIFCTKDKILLNVKKKKKYYFGFNFFYKIRCQKTMVFFDLLQNAILSNMNIVLLNDKKALLMK